MQWKWNNISFDENPGLRQLRIESFAVIKLRDVSTNNSIISFDGYGQKQ